MEIGRIIPHIEALIFASDKPLSPVELTEYVNSALGFIEDRSSQEQVEAAIEGIKEKYDADFYAFELKQSGGGWQFLTKPEYHKTVALINGDKFIKKLSTAALETLAIIAYKQPVTKSEMESIRGVNCDYAVQKLLEKDLVIISGRNEDAVGKPLIYATSRSFMDYFGINSPNDLPKINEVLMEEYAKATAISEESIATEAAELELPLTEPIVSPFTEDENIDLEPITEEGSIEEDVDLPIDEDASLPEANEEETEANEEDIPEDSEALTAETAENFSVDQDDLEDEEKIKENNDSGEA